MKKVQLYLTLMVVALMSTTTNTNAQISNTGIYFQAVARDNYSNPAKDRKIYVQSTLLQGTATGTKVLIEQFQVSTDNTGVFGISVGQGTRTGGTVSGLQNIDWSKGPYFLNLKVAITPESQSIGWDYTKELVDLGTTSFGAVPYALYAGTAAGLDTKLATTDTTKMLAAYAKAMAVQSLSTEVSTKLSVADTTAMLAPYSKAVAALVTSNLTSLTAKAVNDGLNSKVNLADSTNIFVTPKQLASKTFDSTTIYKNLAAKINLADSTTLFVTPTQLASVNAITAISATTATYATTAGTASKVTTNANLTGVVTSVGNTTSIADGAITNAMLANGAVTNLSGTNTGDQTNITGNAGSATKLATARNINGVAFDGTADITLPTSLVDAATLSGTTLASNVINSSLISIGTLTNLTVTNPIVGSITGNASTATTATSAGTASSATKLATARNINGVAFDGSADITLPSSIVDAGTLTGTTLKSTVTSSSLTSVGTLANLTVTNPIVGSITGNAATASSATTAGSASNANYATSAGTISGTLSVNNGGTGQNTIAGIQSILGLNGSKVAIGDRAGQTNQASAGIAIGTTAGQTNQGSQSISIGYVAGYTNQGINSVAIGSNAAQSGQGTQSVALGYAANSAANNATAIGASSSSPYTNSTAIGYQAATTANNTIQLGADGVTVPGSTAISNVRTSGTLTAGAVTYPNSHGTANQVLTTTGTGTLTWTTPNSTPNASTLSGTTLNSTITGSSLTSLGTITSGVWSGTAISVANGGTGVTTLNGLVKGNGTSAFTSAISGTDYQAPITLTTTGTGAATLSGTTLNIPTPATGSSNTHSIGEVYGGGIVFYVWDGGVHGLIAPFNTISRQSTNPLPPIVESQIAINGSLSGVTANGLLAGKNNTLLIVANQGSGYYAASYCYNYTNPTSKTFNSTNYTFPIYSDWYLPSIYELNLFRAFVVNNHASRGVYINYGNNLIYYNGTNGNDNNYAWGKYLSSTMTSSRYKLYYLESGSEDGSTAYNGWTEFDRLVVMPIRSF